MSPEEMQMIQQRKQAAEEERVSILGAVISLWYILKTHAYLIQRL